jgi:hypothetical protein
MPTRALIVAGWLLFLASMPLVAIDADMGGEILRGFETRGYQCFIGAFLAPLGRPEATPLWLIFCAGNLTALGAPLAARWPAAARWCRHSVTSAAGGAWMLVLVGTYVGVTRLYAGYYVWSTALVVLSVAFWAGRRPKAAKTQGDLSGPPQSRT